MTLARFVAGGLLLVVSFIALEVGAARLRRRLLRGWSGLEAGLVDVVIVLTAASLLAELVGTVGLLELPALVISYLVGAAAMAAAGRGAEPVEVTGEVRDTAYSGFGWPGIVAVIGGLVVGGAWVARTVGAIRRGMTTVDTVWYHLPVAARYLQTGRVTSIQYLDDEPVTAFFPATSSLFHAVGMVFVGTDLISTMLNLGWLALALASAWSVGSSYGVAPATTLGAALVLGTAGMVATQPGGAYNDIVGLALVLAAVAVLVHRREEPIRLAQAGIAALALGLAAGTKFTLVLPAAALCIGLAVVAPAGRRLQQGVVVFLCTSLAGGYWYLRNLMIVGNPLPSLSVELGPISLPSAKGRLPTATVSKFLFDGQAWRENFLPGLRDSLGPVWVVIVALSFAGMIAAIACRKDRRLRVLGVVAVASLVGYLYTPQYLVGGFGRPLFFGVNVRYASPALILGLILLPLARPKIARVVLVVYAVALVLTAIDPVVWPTGFGWGSVFDDVRTGDAVLGAVVVIAALSVAAVGVALVRSGRFAGSPRGVTYAAAVAVPLVVLVLLAAVHDRYLDSRYRHLGPYPRSYTWARDVHDQRIAVTGFSMQTQYPYAGLDLSNHVQYAGVRTEHGGWHPIEHCKEWVRFLEQGRYRYAVVGPSHGVSTWTAGQPDARRVLREPIGNHGQSVQVFRLDPSVRGRRCRPVG